MKSTGNYADSHKIIDSSTIVGIIIAFALVATAIFLGGNPKGFVDLRSILIVIFGTLAVTAACFSFKELFDAFAAIIHTIFYRSEDIAGSAVKAISVADTAKKKGVLALEKSDHTAGHNQFLIDGVNMAVDGTNAEDIEKILRYEVDSMAHRHAKGVAVLRKAAEVSPAMGLIGTLIGLVQMLANLQDASTIGPAMAVALLTTFYGAVLSYMFFLPLSSKLERNTRDELVVAEIYIQAMKSIAKRENPRKLEILINSILPPSERIDYYEYMLQEKIKEKNKVE